MPDRWAAVMTSARCWIDAGSRTIAGKAAANRPMPCRATASEIGLDKREYRPSTQWAKPFIEVLAISAAGTSRLAAGSSTISRQASFTSQNSSFLPVASRSPSPGVTSAADAVLGMAMTGSLGCRSSVGKKRSGGSKREAWRSIGSPSASRIAMPLAVSEALPPPMATKPSIA